MTLKNKKISGQTKVAAEKNSNFFLNQYDKYKQDVESIDTYAAIYSALSEQLGSVDYLLDIGNGGVFDYQTSLIKKIIGLDLFLDSLPKNIALPSNVEMVQGSALDIPENLIEFDGVVMVMLIHHLVGSSISACLENVKKSISEAYKVLKPGGKIIIMESCVPEWFYRFEKIVYKPTSFLIERFINHPSTLQYPSPFLLRLIKEAGFKDTSAKNVPLGKYVLQFGVKFPTWLTPVQPVIFTGWKPV